MSIEVSYDRQTINAANPIARFAHHMRVVRSIRIVDAVTPVTGTVLDFGAGTGHFLHELDHCAGGPRHLYAYEPFMALQYPSIPLVTDLRKLQDASIDTLTAFEVCEHLDDDEVEAFVSEARRLLRPSGHLIVSVPIMLGPVVCLKELNRMILFRRRPEYSVGELISALLGGAVERPANRQITHKGFDFRQLERILATSFSVERKFYSPFAVLTWLLNSQVFFVCRLSV